MGPRQDHHGRTTATVDDLAKRPRRRAVIVTAWLIVAGFALAAVFPLVAILLGS